MFDLEKNLLTAVLVGITGVLGLIGALFIVGFFITDVRFIDPADEQAIEINLIEAPDTGLAELSEYAAIIERPVFFPDRRLPVMEVAQVVEEEVEPEPEPDPIEPLQAVVAGIIIAPEYKVALVTDQVAGKVMIMREGMAFEGEQAPWRLTRIGARGADFASTDGQEMALELNVYTSGLSAGSSGMAAQSGESDAASDAAADEAQSRADLIRQRVAERRAELRARAEERALQQQEP